MAEVGPPWADRQRIGSSMRDSGSQLLRTCRFLAVPLVVGIVVWLVLAPLTAWSVDDSVWWWAMAGGTQGITLYHRISFSYPPLWGELLQAVGWGLGRVGIHATALGTTNLAFSPLAITSNSYSIIVTSPLFNLVTKGMLLVFDIGTGLLLYGLVQRATGDARRARMAFALWFLNPIVVVEASVFAGFDLLVAFFVIAAVVLLIADRPAWAGVAMALAILTKGTPIFVLLLFAFFMVERSRTSSTAQGLRRIGSFAAGAIIGAALVMAPVAATGELRTAFNSTFARVGTGADLGGISLFGLSDLRSLGAVGHWLGSVNQLGLWILLLQLATALCATAAAIRVMRRDPVFGLVGGTATVLALVVLLQAVANPQYVLWGLPCLVAVVAVWRRCGTALVLISGAAFLYLLSIGGPAMVVGPLANFTHALTPEQIVHDVTSWGTIDKTIWSLHGGPAVFVGPLSVLAIVGTLLLTYGTLWRRPPGRARVIPARLRAGRASVACVALAVTTLGAFVGEGVVAATPQTASVSLQTATATTAPGTPAGLVTVTAQVHSGAQLEQLHLVAFTAVDVPDNPEVDIYQDAREPLNDSTRAAVSGVATQVRSDLEDRGYRGAVRTVDAAGLGSILQDVGAAQDHVIVDMSGVLPLSVFSLDHDSVTPWLQAGGTIYWGGAPIGTLSGAPGEPDNGPITRYPGSPLSAGISRFIDPSLVGSSDNAASVGTSPTAAALAVGLRYQFNSYGIRTSPPTAGVASIGWIGDGRSSLTVVANGAGRTITFGGPITNTTLVGADVVTSLMSAVPWADGPVTSMAVPQGVVQGGGTIRWSAPVGTAPGDVIVTAIDPSIEGELLVRETSP